MNNHPETLNQLYHALSARSLVGKDKARPKVAFQQSPGKGIVVILLLDFEDMTQRPSAVSLGTYAYGAAVVFPQFMENTRYQQVVSDAIARYGQTGGMSKAELFAACKMIDSAGGHVIFKDDSVLQRIFEIECADSETVLIRGAVCAAQAALGSVELSLPEDPPLKKVADSILLDINADVFDRFLGFEVHPDRLMKAVS